MAIDLVTLALAKKFTKQTAQGGGAVAGKPCQIDSIEAIPGGHRVTFLWELNDGTTQTGQMDVMDGEDGSDIASITQDGKVITIELSDGTSHEFTIPTVKGDKGEKGDKGDAGEAGTDGKGIKAVTIDANEHLIITYTDDTTMDAGKIEVQSAVQSVNGMTGDVELDASDVGALPDDTVIPSKTSELTNDNGFQTASDVSAAISGKVDKVAGKGLSANDYSNADKAIVDGVVTALAGKADKTDVIDGASYDSTNHRILFKKGTTTLFSLDAAAFVKDGMVDAVSITGGNLVITFNTDAGKQAISIPISDIFNADNYYDKDATDDLLDDKTDKVSGAVNGNFAGLDANGNLTDSGKKAADFATPAEVSAQGSTQEALLRDTVGWIGKNLLKNKASTQTVNGVTYTVNADKSVTVNGTGTSPNAGVRELNQHFTLPAGNYILSGSSHNVYSETGFKLQIYNWTDSVEVVTCNTDEDSPFTIGENKDIAVRIWYRGTPSTSGEDITFYPMIRRADILDDTYEPYHESVETMYEEEVHGVNLFKPNFTTKTENGVTYTVNSNNTISTNGTTTADTRTELGKLYLAKGTYTLSGNPYKFNRTSDASIRLRLFNSDDSKIFWDDGDGVTFTIDSPEEYTLAVRYGSGAVFGNTFKPMLRKAAIEDSTYRPYNPQAIQNQINAQGVLGAKNLLENNSVSETINGITFTLNSDGSVTAHGTPTGITRYSFTRKVSNEMNELPSELIGKSVIVSGGYIQNNGTLEISCITRNSSGQDISDHAPANGAKERQFTIESNAAYIRIYAIFDRNEDHTPVNVTMKPMLRLASDPDDTYVPYAMTNRELTEKVADTDTIEVSSFLDSTYVSSCGSFRYRVKNGICFVYINNIKFTSAAIDVVDAVILSEGVLPRGIIPASSMLWSKTVPPVLLGLIRNNDGDIKATVNGINSDNVNLSWYAASFSYPIV